MITQFKIFESQQDDIVKFITYCESIMDIKNIKLGKEYYYESITSCVIDAVFSIGISYEQTRKAVERYNEYFGLKLYRDTAGEFAPQSEQDSLVNLIKRTEKLGAEKMATEVYKNRCRTATHGNAILKSQAVYLFAKILNKYGINYLQDLKQFIGNEQLEKEIRAIPGQTTGISLDYFFMLAGDDTYVKVDRMMMRFMMDAIGKVPNKYEIRDLIIKSVDLLKKKYPDLTPKMLDHQIWLYQRER